MILNNTADTVYFIEKEYMLRDTQLIQLCLDSQSNSLEIRFKIRLQNGEVLELKFSNVEEFSFYHHVRYIFYNINTIKLILNEKGVYFSIDPDEMIAGISENDQDFVWAKEVSGILTRD